MKPSDWRKVSAASLALSVVFLAATIVLPGVKLPQTVQRTVPAIPTPAPQYQIYGYGIPPVLLGSTINVTLSGFAPKGLEYSLAPTLGSGSTTPLAIGKVGSGQVYSFASIAEESYSLELQIIAYNGSGFSIRYSGVWSPYDVLQVYFIPAIFLVTASAAATYYFNTRVPQQLRDEKVEAELRGAPNDDN
ncbi:MAG: hypothetical protein KGI38_08220 [Thaumarchaeota archaeon]|nr:hypothetical protein [Nitrososphaerota archaeon]